MRSSSPFDLSEHPLFESYLKEVFGEDLEAFLKHAPLPTYLRANTLQCDAKKLASILSEYGIETEELGIPGLEALRVTDFIKGSPPGVSFHHFLGSFYIQSLSSMIPPLFLDAQPGERILDLCAAPGSKSTQIGVMMKNQGELWCNELLGKRLTPLASALDAAGIINTHLLQGPGERLPALLNLSFDRVLADVPCSGLGSKGNVEHSAGRFTKRGELSPHLQSVQYRLLLSAAKLVKPGGRIVYSTCSLSPYENEAIVDQLLRHLPFEMIEPPKVPGLVMREGRTEHKGTTYHPSLSIARRISPVDSPTEGFFVAILRRKEEPYPQRHLTPPSPNFEAEMIPSVAANDQSIFPIIQSLSDTYGIPIERLSEQRYHHRQERKLSMVAPQMTHLWSQASRHGTTMGLKRVPSWRLNHLSIRYFRHDISKNVVELTLDQLRELVNEGTTTLNPDQQVETPYPAVAYGALGAFASTIAEGNKLRWKRPRRYTLPVEEFSDGFWL